MFVVDEVDVWVPAVVTAVKHDIISVTIEQTHQVSRLFNNLFFVSCKLKEKLQRLNDHSGENEKKNSRG